METAPASISIRLHMELREGHASSHIRIKVSGINAAKRTISGRRSATRAENSLHYWAELNLNLREASGFDSTRPSSDELSCMKRPQRKHQP